MRLNRSGDKGPGLQPRGVNRRLGPEDVLPLAATSPLP